MKKSQRIIAAKETLKIIETGAYVAPSGKTVEVASLVQHAVAQSRLYAPEDDVKAPQAQQMHQHAGTVEVAAESTLQATQRLYAQGVTDMYCLNFASAKNPGGGFLSGAQAQEESLARSSALYPCLTRHQRMYEFNRYSKSMLYSDYMIYAPAVPVFRDDEGTLLEEPYPVSFITSPAVNMGALLRNTPYELEQVDAVFNARLDKILRIAVAHGHTTLVLGAWGCGVFANDATKMAQLFQSFLGAGAPYSRLFKRIVYAIHDSTVDQKVVGAFKAVLLGH